VKDYSLEIELERESLKLCVCYPSNFPMANENPNFLVLVPDGDGHIIIAYFSTSRFSTFILKSNQQLATLFQRAKFWVPWD
jgi:hypothetical protein